MPRPSTLGARLLLTCVLLVILTALILSAFSTYSGLQAGQERVIGQLESVAVLKEAEIDTWTKSLQANLTIALAEEDRHRFEQVLLRAFPPPPDYEANATRLRQRIQRIAQETQLFDEVFLMDLQGEVVLSTDPSQEKRSHRQQPYFLNGLSAQYISPPAHSPFTSGLSLVVAQPILNEQQHTLGILAGRASLMTLNAMMRERAGLGDTGETYLLGRDRILLTETRQGGMGREITTNAFDALLQTPGAGADVYTDNGQTKVRVYRWLAQLEVLLVAEQDQAEAFSSTYELLGLNLGVTVVATLISVLVMLAITRSVAQPLARLAEMATAVAGGDYHAERLVEVTKRGDELGQVAQAFQQMTQDVQTREANLRHERDLLKALMDSVPDTIYFKDRASRFTRVNRAQAYALGLTDPEAIIGKTEADFFLPQYAQDARADEAAIIATGQPLVDKVEKTERIDGEYVWYSTTKAPIVDERTGQVIGLVGISRDVTERHRAEENLLQARDELERRVQERTDALAQANQSLQAVRQVGLSLTSSLELTDVLRIILSTVFQLWPGVRDAYIYLFDNDQLTFGAAQWFDGRDPPLTAPRTEGLSYRTARSGQAVIVEDMRTDPLFASVRDDPNWQAYLRGSIMYLPLKIGAQVVGVMTVTNHRPQRVSSDMRQVLDLFADQAAVAIENARLFLRGQEELRERQRAEAQLLHQNEYLEALHATTLGLVSRLDLQDLLETVVQHAGQMLNTTHGYIYLINTAETELELRVGVGAFENDAPLQRGEGLAGKVWVAGDPVIVDEYDAWEGRAASFPTNRIRALAGLPLKSNGRVVGVLGMAYGAEASQTFSTPEVELLTRFAQLASIALDNAWLFETTQRHLTQLEAVRQVSLSLTSTLDLASLLQVVLKSVFKLSTETRDAYIYLYQGEVLKFGAALWFDGREAPLTDPVPGGVSYQVAEHGRLINIADMRTDVLYEPVRFNPDWQEYIQGAIIYLPLKIGERVVGVMTVAYQPPRLLPDLEIYILELLADQAAIAIENARLYVASREHARELDALLTAHSALLSTLDLDQLLENILQASLTALPAAQKGTILLYNAEAQQLQIRAVAGYTDPRVRVLDFAGSGGYSARAVRERRSLLISNARSDPEITYMGDIEEVRAIQSAIVSVLWQQGEPVGVIALDADQVAAFSEAEVHLLDAFANTAAVAMANAALYTTAQAELGERRRVEAQLEQHVEQLNLINRVGRQATAFLDRDELLPELAQQIRNTFDFYAVMVFLVNLETEQVELCAAATIEPVNLMEAGLSLGIGQGLVGTAVATAQPVVVGDVSADRRFRSDVRLPRIGSEVALPLRIGNEVLGVLDLERVEHDAFPPNTVRVLQTLADQIAIALHNAELFQMTQAARQEAEDANRLKSRFLANMSHELRTPLNSIINFAYLLSIGSEGEVTLGQTDLLQRISEAGRHLLGLINDILDLAKIEAGRFELFLENVELPDLIAGALATATSLVHDKPVVLRADLPEGLPLVRADHTRVRQVLLNLLSNAAKFTTEGEIVVRAVSEGAQVVFSVTDTGVGIAPADLPKVFAEFVQLDGELTRQTGGTGLGLPISKRFVELHGGKMWAESTVGVGSTFFFTLPRAQTPSVELPVKPAEAPPPMRERTEPRLPAGDARVLVIDDDPAMREVITRQLALARGYQVVELTDSRKAVDWARDSQPDAVILDVMMPQRDGWQVLQALRADPATRDIPVIMCSVLHEQSIALSLTADDYLVKPIQSEELRRILEHFAPLGGRVLAVDDDPNALEIVRRMLGGLTYNLQTLSDGLSGLEAARAQPPDVIVLDLMMPGMSGFDVLAELRADPNTANVPVVVVTAKDLETHERAQLQAAAATLLQKGHFTPDELVNAVKRAVSRGGR